MQIYSDQFIHFYLCRIESVVNEEGSKEDHSHEHGDDHDHSHHHDHNHHHHDEDEHKHGIPIFSLIQFAKRSLSISASPYHVNSTTNIVSMFFGT